MNEDILKHFIDGNIICHNCKTNVKIELRKENITRMVYNKNFHCKCKSIDCHIRDYNIKCFLSFKNNNIAYDLLYNFNTNFTKAFCFDVGERDYNNQCIVDINNFCPFEHSIGKIVDTIYAYRILQ